MSCSFCAWGKSLSLVHCNLFVLGLPVHFIYVNQNFTTWALRSWEKKTSYNGRHLPVSFHFLKMLLFNPGIPRDVPRCRTCSGCTNATSPRTPASLGFMDVHPPKKCMANGIYIGIDPWPCRGTPTSILVGNAMCSWNIWILLKFATLSCH